MDGKSVVTRQEEDRRIPVAPLSDCLFEGDTDGS